MKKIVIILICSISLILLYSRFIGTSGIKVNEYKITNKNIPLEYHGLKVVQISDIHYGSTINESKLKKIVDEINLLNPDIVVLTGDLIDERIPYNKVEIINNLSNINAKLGKYSISGNHDYPIENYNELIINSGFIDLNNNYELIYNDSNQPIIISGISSNNKDTSNLSEKTAKFDSFIAENSIEPVYSILLIHEPDFIDKISLENYNLVLAGHTHNGQINIPLLKKLYLPKNGKKYSGGYYNISNTDIFISNGLGTSWLKFRLFSRPSINFYRITNN